MDWGALFKSPSDKGFTDSPLFFSLFASFLSGFALYSIAVGRMAVGKHGSSFVTRASEPGLFWFGTLLVLALGVGMFGLAWQRYRRNLDA